MNNIPNPFLFAAVISGMQAFLIAAIFAATGSNRPSRDRFLAVGASISPLILGGIFVLVHFATSHAR